MLERKRAGLGWAGVAVAVGLQVGAVQPARAQTAATLEDLRGLAPVSALDKTMAGRAALAANLRVTGGIENGTISQPTLLPFPAQETQALKDAYAPGHNLALLADGLGTGLGTAYTDRFRIIDRKDATPLTPAMERLVGFALNTAGGHSQIAKFFFGNGTQENGAPVSAQAQAIYTAIGGSPDPFGRAYHLQAGSAGADPFGDSRPFQTERNFKHYAGNDLFGAATNDQYNDGNLMNLVKSPSYPSGHTTFGYTGSLLLALLVPERYQQMVARGAEYGNDRIVIGAHYAMDVLGGRALAMHDMAHMLANDPAYVQQAAGRNGAPIGDFQAALRAARTELRPILEKNCGTTIAACAAKDTGRFRDAARNRAFYLATQTYGLGVAQSRTAGEKEDVGKLAPEAGNLLTEAFPGLSLQEADRILTETEGPGGGFLDDGSDFGIYSRIDLYAAAGVAEQRAARH